jgi:Family of unknown function (DUF6228)
VSVLFLINSSIDEAALELTSFDATFFVANLRSRGVNATARVGTYMANGLAELFGFFSDNWKGWEGSKRWSSLEGELSIEANSDRLGHVYLMVRLREGVLAKWTLQANIVLEAGMLADLAVRAKRFEVAVIAAA